MYLLLAGIGCAQRNVAVSTAPAVAELPDLTHAERSLPVTVNVEGRYQPKVVILGDLPEPEPTPEERIALGLDKGHIGWLLYPPPSQPEDSLVGPWYGGATIANHSAGELSVAVGWITPNIGVSRERGIAIAHDTFGRSIAARRTADPVNIGVGDRGAVTIGWGHASTIAQRARNVGP